MGLSRLAHYSIRTLDLAATERFYTQALGFRVGFRPPFDFPGLWLYNSDDESGYGIVHIIGIDPDNPEGLKQYLGDKDLTSLSGGGAIDHIAFEATGWIALRGRLASLGIPHRARSVPSLGLFQVFVDDPSGVTIELNYPADEPV
jgi:catechol 2,3-dioxygenase-like lactoylglutathione lyase family enzyme